MNYETILVEKNTDITTITFNRVKQRNSLSGQLIDECIQVLDEAEKDPETKAIVLQGKEGFFCTGMDFEQVAKNAMSNIPTFSPDNYMGLLKRFNTISKIIIAKVDGRVLAGGMGVVAACDLVIASSKAQFGLSEAMWGLLPANVMPFLIRRVGFQPAYLMTLTMQNITVEKAKEIRLVDEVSENLDDCLRRYMICFRRVHTKTIGEAKQFFKKMWIINEEMEQSAIDELQKLISQEDVVNNIKNYVQNGKLPYEKG